MGLREKVTCRVVVVAKCRCGFGVRPQIPFQQALVTSMWDVRYWSAIQCSHCTLPNGKPEASMLQQ